MRWPPGKGFGWIGGGGGTGPFGDGGSVLVWPENDDGD